jgi:circadian clock protein KaiB
MNECHLTLYVTGKSPRTERTVARLRDLCAEVLPGGCQIEVIDVLERPDQAEADRIFATPTLIRTWPLPVRRIIGDFSNGAELRTALELPAASDSRPVNPPTAGKTTAGHSNAGRSSGQ